MAYDSLMNGKCQDVMAVISRVCFGMVGDGGAMGRGGEKRP